MLVATWLLAALAAGPAGAAAMAKGAAGPALAARIDGQGLHAMTVDALWRQRRARQPSLTRPALVDALVAERLLARHARSAYGAALASGRAVAFAPEVALEQRLGATLREVFGSEIEAGIRQLPGATLDALVLSQPQADLQAIFGNGGQLRLDVTLGAAQQELAARLPVLRYRLPGAAQAATFSMLDIYRRQNVQGRIALAQNPAAYAAQQAKQALAALYVLHWGEDRFGAAAMADLRQALADQETVAALERLHGIGADTDSGSELLNAIAAETGAAEIEAYYQRHKEDFSRIDKVRARHIRLPDEAGAQAAYQALQEGADFAATARRWSRAPDARRGGSLGWLRSSSAQDWLAGIAFSQPLGQASKPIRAPVGPNDAAYWEIVLVEQRVQGYHPPQSETVRYIASRAIARAKAAGMLRARREELLRAANIELVAAP